MSSREILMYRDGQCLKPYGDAEAEAFAANLTGISKPILVTFRQPRNPEHHAKFWALAAAVARFDKDFVDAADAVEWVKMHIPNMRSIVVMRDGVVVVRTKSISFANMEQIAFGRFYDRATWLWSEKIGCDPETLLAQTEEAA